MCVLELLDCFILYLSPFLSFSLRLFFPPRSFLPAFQSTFLSVQTHRGGGGDECRFVTLSIVVNYLVWYVFFKFKENIVNRITRCNRDKVLLTMIQVTYVYTYVYIDIFKRANFNWFKFLVAQTSTIFVLSFKENSNLRNPFFFFQNQNRYILLPSPSISYFSYIVSSWLRDINNEISLNSWGSILPVHI